MTFEFNFRMATNFSLPFSGGGTVRSRVSATNRGLRAAWFDAWYPGKADDEFCIIVEDDLELSQLWYVWLKKAWAAYGHREDVAGIALSVRYHLLYVAFMFSFACWCVEKLLFCTAPPKTLAAPCYDSKLVS